MTSTCGTYAGYQQHHAKGEKACTSCTAANTAYHARLRQTRAADPKAADRAGHGKGSTYRNCGCRCQPCRLANSADGRARRQKERAS